MSVFMMETRVTIVLLSAAVTLLGCGQVTAVAPGTSDRPICDLSLFRSLSPAVISTFWNAQKLYVRIRSGSGSGPSSLLASTDQLRTLSVPERRILVRAEFELFSAVLSNRTEGIPGAAGRKVQDTLGFITAKLEQCVTADGLRDDRYSPDLSRLLQRLKDDLQTDQSGTVAGKVVVHLLQLLNEHLTCAAKGASC